MKRVGGLIVGVLALTVGTTGVSAASAPTVTTEELLAALPSGGEWPLGWKSGGGEPNTQLIPDSGNNVGLCGGRNSAARAVDSGVVAYAGSPPLWAGPTIRAGVELYGFAGESGAQAYMDTTAEQIESCAERQQDFMLPESEFGQYGPTQNPEIENALWRVLVVESSGAVDVEADEAFFYQRDLEYSRVGGNVPTGGREVSFALLERHDDVVIVLALDGSCCEYGFSDVEAHVEHKLPNLIDLVTLAGAVRPGMLEDLQLS